MFSEREARAGVRTSILAARPSVIGHCQKAEPYLDLEAAVTGGC